MGPEDQQFVKNGHDRAAGAARAVPRNDYSQRWWKVLRREILDIEIWSVRRAWLHERRGRLGAAEAVYRRILTRRPNQPHALSGLGFLLLRARRFDEAVPIWEKAVSMEPERVSANFQLARALHRSGRFQLASEQYLRTLALDPLHDKALEALGQLGRRLARLRRPSPASGGLDDPAEPGHPQEGKGTPALAAGISAAAAVLIPRSADLALQKFEMALGLVPDHPEAQRGLHESRHEVDQGHAPQAPQHLNTSGVANAGEIQLARNAYNQKKFELAENICRRVLVADAVNETALSLLSRICMRASRWHDAIEFLTRLSAAQPAAPEPKEILASALLLDNQLAAAVGLFEELLELQPDNVRHLQSLGRLHGRLGQWNSACRVLRRLVEIDGSSAASRLAFGEALQHAGRVREAESQFEEAVVAAPDNADALTLLGRLRLKSSPDSALDCWKRLAEMRPQSVEPPLQMARLHMRQKGHAEALPLFRSVLVLRPDHDEALRGVGQALAELNLAEAVQHFARLAEHSPDDLRLQLELARYCVKARDWARGEAVYRQILERQPRHREVLSQLAQLLGRDPGRLIESLEMWGRAAEADPKASYPLVQRAYLLERSKRLSEAEEEYRTALQRVRHDAMALIGLARMLAGQKRWAEAAQHYGSLHEADPRRSDALLGLGRCLERLDRSEEALVQYQKVLALDPLNANALLYRGRLLRLLGQSDEAIEAWSQICKQAPHNADAWHELVFLLASAERDAEALAALQEAEAALPAVATTFVRLGLAAQAGQFNDRAVGYFERAIAAEPEMAQHHALLGRHYFRQGVINRAFRHLLASRELEPSDVTVTKQLIDAMHVLNIVGIDTVALATAAHQSDDILVPEQLFRQVRAIADSQTSIYQPLPRRIIAVTASLAAGGAERQLVNMLRGLSDPVLSLDLSLFCVSLTRQTRRDFFLPLLADTSLEIRTPDEGALETYLSQPEVVPYARLIRSFPADMAMPIAFWLGEFRRRRPQVVHAWQDGTSLTAAVAALLAGVPRIVLAARSVRPDNPRRRLKRFMREAYLWVLDHPSVILTNNSHAGANDYAAWLDRDPESIPVVYNGMDFERMAQSVDLQRVAVLRSRLGLSQDSPLVGSVFRMSEEKRPLLWVETAAEIARRVPTAHFVVFGDGPLRAAMVEAAHHLGIGNRFHLPGPDENIGSCYKAMDVVLLTSRHEGLPNVLLEAQSLGVPVVAPNVGGVGEALLDGITGWAVPDADASALAKRVVQCLMDKDWAARARREAPSFVRQRFGMRNMLQRTLQIYGVTPVDTALS